MANFHGCKGARFVTRSLGFLRRLARDQGGNTLAIVAAAMLPLTAMIGSGVDMSRAYMAQSRLQQACDAAALAGRRVMTDGTADATVRSEATKFMNFNFPQGKYQTAAFTPSITASGGNTVIVTAATTMPTAVMKIFGINTMAINANCNARQDYVNTDVVLVLDNTGSMQCKPSQTSCSYDAGSLSKMQGLRDAVMALYDALTPAQTQLTAAGLRMRYAIVPYSQTVRVANLVYGLNSGYLQNPGYYWQCNNSYCNNMQLKKGDNESASYFTNTSTTWGGCIQEASTVNTINSSSGYTIPSNAYDMQIDLVPTTGNGSNARKTQWQAYDPAQNSDAGGQTACPKAAAKELQTWTRSALLSYVNTFDPDGGTYSDIGMVWGGRMLSRNGIWSSINPTTYGNMPVNRYLILMTDGMIDTSASAYTAWGVDQYDNAISTSNSKSVQDANHKQRFSMICNSVKAAGVSIWVIGFGSGIGSLDSTLSGCASNSNQASFSADSDSLIDRFTQIGNAIGALRITQ